MERRRDPLAFDTRSASAGEASVSSPDKNLAGARFPGKIGAYQEDGRVRRP